MVTPRTIDLHTHMLPERWPDLRERYGYGGWISLEHCADCKARIMIDGKVFREIESNCWDAARRTAECDAAGVDMQALSTVPVMFSYGAKARDAHDLSRFLNDHLAEVVRERPDRFVALGTVPLQDGALAARELERCVKELHFPGAQIGTNVAGRDLDDSGLDEFFAAAESLGAALFIHPWDVVGRNEIPRFWMPWLVGMPAETSRAACSLAFGGVLDRHPKLRICFAHGGGSFPYTLGRIEKGFLARPDLCATHSSTNPRDHLRRLYFDSIVHDPEALRYLVKTVGANRIAMGSDYPFPLGEHPPGALIRGADWLTPAQKQSMLAGTAIEFLGLTKRFATPETRATNSKR
ncbi:MAG: amidohydrolase [Planctomycetes bacterium]|nr:amidohydrolase [Planctomycetota bacterium]